MTRLRRFLVVLAAVLVLAVVAVGASLPHQNPVRAIPDVTLPGRQPPPEPPASQPPPPTPSGTFSQSPQAAATSALIGQIVTTVLLVAAVLLAGALLLAIGRALHQVLAQRRPEEAAEVVTDPLVDLDRAQQVIARARRQLDVTGDTNLVVVNCWQSLEDLATEAGLVRRPSQTAVEFVVQALVGSGFPEDGAAELATRYETALFSGRQLSAADADRARAVLTAMEAAFETREPR